MSPGTSDDLASELVRRRQFLTAIAEHQPVSSRAVAGALDTSVSTVNRVVSSFERTGILRRTEAGITLTHTGQLLHNRTHDVVATVEVATDMRRIVEAVGQSPYTIEIDWFRGGSVSHATPTDPYRPLVRYSELFTRASRKRIVGDRFVVPQQGIVAACRSIEEGLDCTCVWSETALERMRAQHPELVDWSGGRENLTAFVASRAPFDFAIFDDRLLLYTFEPDRGTMDVLADTTDPAALEWGRDVFTACRRAAEPITGTDTTIGEAPAAQSSDSN